MAITTLDNGELKSSFRSKLNTNFSELNDRTPIAQPDLGYYVCIGDSITSNNSQEALTGYQAHIMNALNFSSLLTKGYSGGNLAKLGSAEGIAFNIQLGQGIGVPDVVSILVGNNDHNNDVPLGATTDYINATGRLTYYGAWRYIIDYLYSVAPNCKIFIITTLRKPTNPANTNGDFLEDFNDAAKWVAKHEGIYVEDIASTSGINARNKNYYSSDGTHPNNLGYELMSRPIIHKMKKHLLNHV